MKLYISLLGGLLLTACNNSMEHHHSPSPLEPHRAYHIKLAENLGNLVIELPERYDTSFSWTHYSDCGKPCDRIKYRVQPALLPIRMESGWLWFENAEDSIERFTITHAADLTVYYNDNDSLTVLRFHSNRKENLLASPETYRLKSDTIEKIGDRLVSSYVVDIYDSSKRQYNKKVLGATGINGHIIHLDFELLTKDTGVITKNFITDAYYYLRGLRIIKD